MWLLKIILSVIAHFIWFFSGCFHFSWERKIPLVCSGLERTWLFHEIGWCYLELGRHKEARDYGTQSAAAADEIADEKWQINANVLVAQSQCNYLPVVIFPYYYYYYIFFLHIYKITNSDSQFPSVSVKLGNFKSCVSHFERALTKAKLQEDESAKNAIQKVPTLPRLLFVPFKDVCHPWHLSFCF